MIEPPDLPFHVEGNCRRLSPWVAADGVRDGRVRDWERLRVMIISVASDGTASVITSLTPPTERWSSGARLPLVDETTSTG